MVHIRKRYAICKADYELAEGRRKLELYRELEELGKALQNKPLESVDQRVLEIENQFEKSCYFIMKASGKLNNVSYTMEQIRALTCFEFYSLKEQLENDLPSGNQETNYDYD